MADLSPKQAAKLLRLVPGAIQQAVETEQAIAILDLEADIKTRVFLEGQKVSGGGIGKYSTKPAYFGILATQRKYGSQIPTANLKPRGKTKKGKKALFREVNADEGTELVLRRSMYFSDGYAGFRALMGRPIDKVNLSLTNNLAGSIESGTKENVSTIAYTNDHAREVAEGNEIRFGGKKGTIFRAADGEIDALTDRLRKAAQQAMDKLFPQ